LIAKAVQDWIAAVGARTAYIAPGSPWENGYVESFNARLRQEMNPFDVPRFGCEPERLRRNTEQTSGPVQIEPRLYSIRRWPKDRYLVAQSERGDPVNSSGISGHLGGVIFGQARGREASRGARPPQRREPSERLRGRSSFTEPSTALPQQPPAIAVDRPVWLKVTSLRKSLSRRS
jgi:transposase InsO family protein